ncbi:MAG TPA: aminodeoxychorismate synthase component I [Steroidobacteraceae bacterium]|nr:aminodeoxychorismate synthase component I [Steroidobacteraceae bacterium]
MAPTLRSFSAEFEPLGLVARFPERYPGILQSGEVAAGPRAKSRFDILPISNGEVLAYGAPPRDPAPRGTAGKGFLDGFERWWRELQTARGALDAPLPFAGGWLVYLGYELAGEIEPRLRLPPAADAPSGLAIRTPAAWVRDCATRRAWLVAEIGAEALLDRFEADAAGRGEFSRAPAAAIVVREEPAEQFLQAVRRALEYTAAGEVYQTNLSRRWWGESAAWIDPVALYRRLCAANPSPFAALLRHGDFAVVSSSPERLLAIRGDLAETRPIAGTRPRGASPGEDAALIRSLLASEKERAEHVMLIDLERNDLGRVCRGGTVRVDEYMSVESYAHVHHIVSNVSGRLREDLSPIDAVRAVFPGGTITGCPKIRCMQIIAELEGTGRGAYTGSIGYVNRDGSCDFNILIRTITASGPRIELRAGAGIVADSNPLQELAETRAKAEGLLRALQDCP